MIERSGGRERSEQSGASERVSGASERANGRASGPVLQSVFLAFIDHSGGVFQLPKFSVMKLTVILIIKNIFFALIIE